MNARPRRARLPFGQARRQQARLRRPGAVLRQGGALPGASGGDRRKGGGRRRASGRRWCQGSDASFPRPNARCLEYNRGVTRKFPRGYAPSPEVPGPGAVSAGLGRSRTFRFMAWDECQELAVPFGLDVNLAGEAPAASTECLVFLAATSSTCSVLTSAYRTAIDEVPKDRSITPSWSAAQR